MTSEIITPLYRKSSSNFKISVSDLLADCEVRLLLLIFTSYLPKVMGILMTYPLTYDFDD